jgi:putative hydrolase of the HAD superfamily
MKIRGILFDLYGTLIDIHTDESSDEIYRAISHFLTYQGISLDRQEIRDQYYRIMEEQRRARGEEYPEFDAVKVWREIIRRNPGTSALIPAARLKLLPGFLAEIYRGISRQRLKLYPEVKTVLDALRTRFRLAVVSDGQSCWAVPEMRALGVESYFDPIIVSSNYGFRKPDGRLFEMALSRLGLAPKQVVFVGNDMYRDIFGAVRLGIKTVYFSSSQGTKEMEGVEPDYIIHQFAELRQAISFLERQ